MNLGLWCWVCSFHPSCCLFWGSGVGGLGGCPGRCTGKGSGEGRAPGPVREGLEMRSGVEGQPWGCPRPRCQGTGAGRQDEEARSPRRANNGTARFKFQISPRQMSLGKELFVFAVTGRGVAGMRLDGPSLSRAATLILSGGTVPRCGGPALYRVQSSFPTISRTSLPAAAWGLGRDAQSHIPG